jgi:redox-sensing transcriptional repressor
MMQIPTLPPAVVPRLTKYLALIQQLSSEGVQWVSSQDLADALGLTSSTVRQDLSHVDYSGISKRGYETTGLEKVLAGILGADREWKTVVIGAGNLGMALARHEEFLRHGFTMCGVFDSDEKKIGRKVGRLTVRGMRDLPAFVGSEMVQVGVLAVPASAAQSCADLLIASGIKGLLNLSLAHLIAPRTVAVMDSRMIASLIELTHAITLRQNPSSP